MSDFRHADLQGYRFEQVRPALDTVLELRRDRMATVRRDLAVLEPGGADA